MNKRLLIQAVCIVALAFAGQIGCSHTPKRTDASGPEIRINLENPRDLPDDTKVNLGAIGIISGRYDPDIKLRDPMNKTAGAFSGAGASALSVAKTAGGMGKAGVFLLPLIPVAAVVGAIAGGSAGVQAEKVAGAKTSIGRAIRDLGIQETLHNQLMEIVRGRRAYPVIRVEGLGPASLGARASYDSFPGMNLDSIFEIGVTSVNLEGFGYTPGSGLEYINSFLWLSIDTRVRLVRVADNTEVFNRPFSTTCYGQRLRLLEWAANDAALLRQEISKCLPSVGDRILKDFWDPSRDLTGKWISLYQTCSVDRCEITGKFLFQNAGNMDAAGSTIRFYLSEDGSFAEGKNPLLTEVTTTPIEGAGDQVIRLERHFGQDQDLRRKYIIAIIDPENTIVESDKRNNYVMGPIN
jgi:hypothetical protein